MPKSSTDWFYALVPGANPDSSYKQIYEKTYTCWSEVWTQAYAELGLQKKLHSDAFTRQDYVGALFYQNECVALSFFRNANSKESCFAQDSYFANWNDKHRAVLSSKGSKIIVCSNFTIHQKARGKSLGLSLKDLLVGISIETFLRSDADAMTGALRRDRNVNGACARWGGYEIATNIDSGYGDTVDLMAFFKDHILSQPLPDLKSVVNDLWEDRIEIPRQGISFDHKPRHLRIAA